MNKKVEEALTLERVELMFKNFAGERRRYNNEGDRNFSVRITSPKLAAEIAQLGWNVRELKARDEDSEPEWHLPVRVSYRYFPPRVVVIKRNGKLYLDEDNIQMIDRTRVISADLVLNPHNWTSEDGNSGVTAYLREMWVTLEESKFGEKYGDLPDINRQR